MAVEQQVCLRIVALCFVDLRLDMLALDSGIGPRDPPPSAWYSLCAANSPAVCAHCMCSFRPGRLRRTRWARCGWPCRWWWWGVGDAEGERWRREARLVHDRDPAPLPEWWWWWVTRLHLSAAWCLVRGCLASPTSKHCDGWRGGASANRHSLGANTEGEQLHSLRRGASGGLVGKPSSRKKQEAALSYSF